MLTIKNAFKDKAGSPPSSLTNMSLVYGGVYEAMCGFINMDLP